jgi:phage portal protein BeeE
MKLPSFLSRRPRAAAETKASGFFALTAEGRAHWSSRSYASLSREGFMKNPVAHRAVRMIAEAAASVPWLAYAGEAERPDEPLLALIARPNGRMAGTDFFETLYGHLMLSGNAFVEGVRVGEELRELHLLRPDRMRVIEGRDGWPEAYEYRAGSHVRRHMAGEGQAILHLRLFHPLDDQVGFAPLEAASMALDLSNAAAIWNKALLDNSARPSGALVYQPKEGGNLTPDQYDRLKNELEEGYSGRRGPGGRCCWKAGSTGRRWGFHRARWISSRRRTGPRATSRSPSACHPCWSAFRGTRPMPITRRPTAPSGG